MLPVASDSTEPAPVGGPRRAGLPPNAARVGDYLLGGIQHLPADRAFARALEERAPDVRGVCRALRGFLGGALAALSDRDDPGGLVSGYAAGLSAGSYLVTWHASADNWSNAESAASRWAEQVGPALLWTRRRIEDCLCGLDLVPPGIVDATAWRPRRATPARGERPGVYTAVVRL